MTALCGGGPSQIKPLQDALVTLAAGDIIDLLVTGEIGWAGQIAAGVGYLTYDLTGLCTRDPAAAPSMDPAFIAGFFNPLNTQGATQLRQWVTTLLERYLWNLYCECTSGPQPPPPAPVAQPPGLQLPGGGVGVQAPGACGNGPSAFSSVTLDANGNASQSLLANDPVTTAVQWAQWQIEVGSNLGAGNVPLTFDLDVTVRSVPASLGVVSQQRIPANTATQFFYNEFQVPAGMTSVTLELSAPSQPGATFALDFRSRWYCSAPPTSILAPCCPPDPTLENLIIQVMRLEEQILSLLGRAAGYTRGTVHPSLTGTGTISVSGLFGVLIELTTGVPTTPQLPGVPPYEFSVGWISCLTGDGMIDETRITRQSQVWASRLAPLATTYGYQLNQGFTATVTELVPA